MRNITILDYINELAFDIDVLGSWTGPRTCEGCGVISHRVIDCPSQTQYCVDDDVPNGPDPNADKILCIECAIRYTEDMNAQWAEYYSGLL